LLSESRGCSGGASKTFSRIRDVKSSTVKRLGVLIALVGAPVLHYAVPGAFWIRTSAAIAAGLMMIFFSRESIDDERVQDLKLKAVNAAFSVSFTLTLILNWLLNRDFDIRRDFSGATGAYRSISAFDLIILTMIVALALFHYWRLRDSDSRDTLRPWRHTREAGP
jgi:hypothetical protein